MIYLDNEHLHWALGTSFGRWVGTCMLKGKVARVYYRFFAISSILIIMGDLEFEQPNGMNTYLFLQPGDVGLLTKCRYTQTRNLLSQISTISYWCD